MNMTDDDTEQFLRPSSNDNGPISGNETGKEDVKAKKARIAKKNLEKARDILKLIKENEKNHKPEPENEPDEPENEDTTENTTENTTEGSNKQRLQSYMSAGERGKLLRELRKIWQNPKNKGSEICSAASLYAELQGYKLKTSDTSEGAIMRIEFDIATAPKPANKMLEPTQVTTKETTNATTTPPETAQLEGPLDDANKKLDELADFEDVSLLDGPVTTVDDKQTNE